MAGFKPIDQLPDIEGLQSVFTGAAQQTSNPAFYQTIVNFLKATGQIKRIFNQRTEDNAASIVNLSNEPYLTAGVASPVLPNFRNLLPGTSVTFDDTVANERTVNVTGSAALGYYEPLTDGDVVTPELIFALGDVITVFIP